MPKSSVECFASKKNSARRLGGATGHAVSYRDLEVHLVLSRDWELWRGVRIPLQLQQSGIGRYSTYLLYLRADPIYRGSGHCWRFRRVSSGDM